MSLAQFGLEHLTVVVLRQRLEENVAARPLEARDRGKAERIQFFGRYRLRRTRDDAGDDFLAPVRVRAADDRNLEHAGMAQQHFLDLARIDVAAAADDQVLGAVLQGEKTLVVEGAHIAGVQPAAAQASAVAAGFLQ